MPGVADLTGLNVDNWHVTRKLPAMARVQMVEVACDGCDGTVALRYTIVRDALTGGTPLPPCVACAPTAAPHIDRGMHLGLNDPPHRVGTACADPADAAGREPAVDHDEPVIIWQGKDVPTPLERATAVREQDEASRRLWEGDVAAAQRVHGRAEAIDGAQDVLGVIARHASWVGRPGNGTAGMSSLGTPCDRKLGFKLAFGTTDGGPAWRPYVGTAVHVALDQAFALDHDPRTAGRWLTKVRFTEPAWGELDLFDLVRGQVIDFKVPGITAVRKAYKGDVGAAYETQLDLYGLGMTLRGFDVHSVANLVIPSAGELHEAAWVERPWDRGNAERAIERRDRLNAELAPHGQHEPARQAVMALPIAEDSCDYCPVKASGMCDGAVPLPPPPVGWAGPTFAPAPMPPPPPGVS